MKEVNRNTEVTFYNLGSACGYLLFVPHCTHFMPHILALWSRKSLKALEFNDIMSLRVRYVLRRNCCRVNEI